MARKRKNDLDSWNKSLGYSNEALKALSSGTYDQLTGRDPKYRTSQEQTQQSRQLPVLEGLTRSNDWESSFGRNKVDTVGARQKYAEKNNYKPIGRSLSNEDEELLYKTFDRNRLSFGGNAAIVHQLKNNIWHNTKDWEEKYGKTIEQIVEDYSKDYEKIAEKRNTEKGKNNKVLTTLTNTLRGGTVEPALDTMSTLAGKVAPNSPLTKAYRDAAEKYSKQKKQTVEGVTGNMSGVGKQAYELGTGLGERAIQYANPSALKYVLTVGKTAENTRQSLKERGIEGTNAEIQSGLAGLVDAGLDIVGLESVPALKGLVDSGNIGKEVLGRMLIGGGEQGLTNLINNASDRLFNGDKSLHNIAVQNYINQGMTAEEAENQATKDEAYNLAEATVSGGLLNNLVGFGGRMLGNVPSLFKRSDTTRADVPKTESTQPDVIKAAQAQAEGAAAEIDNLAKQIPETEGLSGKELASRMDDNYNTYTPTGDVSSMDVPHQLAERMAAAYEHFDTYGYMDELQGVDGFVEQMADDISKGRDLTGYIDSLYENIDETDDPAIQSEIQGLINDLTKIKGTAPDENTPNTPKDTPETKGLVGDDLKTAQDRVTSNKSKIKALENEIKIIENDPNNKYRGNLKKSAKADIDSKKAQIAELKQDNKVTTRQIKGEPTPVIEQLDADSVTRINDFKKEVRKIGNMWGGEGGKQLAKDVNDALDRYVESGSQEDFNTFARDLWQLHSSANGEYTSKAGNVSRYSDYYGDIEDGIFGASIKDNGMLPQKAISDFHKARTMNESVGRNPTLTSEVPPTNTTSDNGVSGYEPPLVTEPERTDATGMSRVVTRAAVDADVLTEYNIESDPTIQEIAKYAKANNELTFENAKKNVTENGDKLLEEYNSDRRIIDNDQDVDQAMLLLRKLTQDYRGAKDPAVKDALYNQRNMLLSRLRKAGTKWGQSVQAFAKWNDTPEGAMINGERMLSDTTKVWESRNQERVKANNNIAEELDNIGRDVIRNDGGYSPKKTSGKKEPTSSRLDKALRQQGYDGTMEGEPKAPKTHEQHRIEVENSIRKELGSVADQFNDNDFEFLTNLVENKVPVETIIDEIEHRLNHGEWYTIDESTPIKKATSSKLANILKNMGDDSRKAKNAKPETGYPAKSHDTIAQEVANTLEGEYAGLGLDTPTDIEFMTIMLEEGVPNWQIEDEINHRLMTGEWYSLDESVEPPKKGNTKLQNALNSLVNAGEETPQAELSLDEIKEQVRTTLSKETASNGDFSEEDINYLANLINNGATKQELADALNTKFATGTFAISQSTQSKVNALFEYAEKFDPNSRQACEAKAAAYNLIAEEVVGDASPFEKYEAWRFIAMLGNPKTMLRNVVGNTMFNAVTGVSNNLSAVLEGTVDKASRALGGNGIQRTKAVLNPATDGGLIKGAWEDAESHRYKQLAGSKYEKNSIRDTIKGEKSVFRSKIMQKIESAVDKGISDYPAIRTKYSTSLAGWMKANGLDESAFGAEGQYQRLNNLSQTRVLTNAEKAEMESLKRTMDALDKGRDYALKAAEYATFHEDNAVAEFLSQQSRKLMSSDKKSLRALGYGLEGVVPFKKTPANILRSGFEYSPLGAIDSIKKTGKLIYENTGKRKSNLGDTYTKKSWWRNNESEVERTLASDVIDSWSKTLTGTGLATLGYYLMSKGILNSSENDEKYQDDLEGIQNYSITINGKTYTIDWAAPAVMPLLLGAEVKKIFDRHAIPDEKWYGNADEIIGSINSLLNPVFETSMLQGIQNVMESAANEVKYNENGAIGGILGSAAMNAVTGYGTQAIPTLLGQIARTVDPTRRTTDTASDSNFLSGVEKQARKIENKIPGLSFLNPQYRDAYGRTQGNSPYDNVLGNLAYQMLSPAYVREINTTDADIMARNVYNATAPDENGNQVPIHNKDVFAPWKSKVTYGGQKLSPEQMEVYRQASGEASYEIRDALSKEEWFNNLDGSKQTEILTSLKSLVNKVGLEANGFPQTGKDYEAYQSGGVEALLNKFKGTADNSEIKEKTGLAPTSNAAKIIKADMESGNTQAAEEKIDEATQLSNLGFTKPNPTETYYKAKSLVPSLTPDQFAKTYREIDGADGSEPNQGIKQDELIAYFNKNHFTSESEAMKYWNMYAPKGKKVPYLKKDGTWGKH